MRREAGPDLTRHDRQNESVRPIVAVRPLSELPNAVTYRSWLQYVFILIVRVMDLPQVTSVIISVAVHRTGYMGRASTRLSRVVFVDGIYYNWYDSSISVFSPVTTILYPQRRKPSGSRYFCS